MKKISLEALACEDEFSLIGKEWMLITAGTPDRVNTMTASWGGFGWLWNKPVAFIFVRPERFTYPLIEANDFLTLSFYDNTPQMRKVLNYCGVVSGRDHDKIKEMGLTPVTTDHGATTFAQARLTIEGRKLFRLPMTEAAFIDKECLARWYNSKPGGSLHTIYVVEIEGVYAQD